MKKAQNEAVIDFKSRVDRMENFLKSQGYAVQHMHLVEGLAKYEGSRDWRTYRAQLTATPAAPAAMRDTDDVEELNMGIQPGEATDAQAAAMAEMLYEWDDDLSFADILAVLRGTNTDGHASATDGYTHLSSEQLADNLEARARELEGATIESPAQRVTSSVEDHALSCLEYWGSLTYDEILGILDSEDPERRKEIDVHPSLVGFSNKELSEIIRREHRWALSQAAVQNPDI